jgi:DNA-binding transcriptional ArsR family regulator
MFSAMSHQKRRGILDTLAYRPATIKQLARESKLSLPAIHKHMDALEKARLVHRRKVGRTNFIALNSKSMSELQDWINQYQTGWGNDKETLENYIASFKD